MMEINQRKTPIYKWADIDFDFISPQSQPRTGRNFPDHTQGKHSSTKNINIPTCTPPLPTKNAQKLAEIANKIKVELPKSNIE
jgi:hypothetical protein